MMSVTPVTPLTWEWVTRYSIYAYGMERVDILFYNEKLFVCIFNMFIDAYDKYYNIRSLEKCSMFFYCEYSECERIFFKENIKDILLVVYFI